VLNFKKTLELQGRKGKVNTTTICSYSQKLNNSCKPSGVNVVQQYTI